MTPSDSADLVPAGKGNTSDGGLADALYIGGAGDVTLLDQGGTAVLFKAVPVGTIIPFRTRRVKSTGTTATNILALYNI